MATNLSKGSNQAFTFVYLSLIFIILKDKDTTNWANICHRAKPSEGCYALLFPDTKSGTVESNLESNCRRERRNVNEGV